METVRVRLVFEDQHILSKRQRSDGLKRSWLLLNPEHYKTISDLSSHLLHIFDLRHSCPNGVLLSMEGFVLPHFESTCILKDKEIVCVKRKGGTASDAIEAGGVADLLDVEIVEKQPVDTGVLLLANEEFEKETGGYESESEEDEEDQLEDIEPLENSSGDNAVSKKRKASTKLQSSKKKKHRSVVLDGVGNEVQTEEIDNYQNDEPLPKKSTRKKEKASDIKSKTNVASSPGSAERSSQKVASPLKVTRSDPPEDNGQGVEHAAPVPHVTKKVPSRSARRKKAKRQWMREIAKISKKKPWKSESTKAENKEPWKSSTKVENKEVVCQPKGLLHWKQLPEKPVHKNMIEKEETNRDGDADTEIVPIVIRPGHIRFEPLEKDQAAKKSQVSNDQAAKQNQVSNESFQWNGITSKKKGQKWGTEKFSSARRNDTEDLRKDYSKLSTTEKVVPVNDPMDLEKLPPFPGSPKEGDVIAYRLLELSSSWTPELSSLRVGKISWYDPESSKIVLTQVPEYPLVSEKVDEGEPANSLYGEDGSLEINFSSLVDLRIVKQSNSDPVKAVSNGVNQTSPGHKDATSNVVPSKNENRAHVSAPGNGEVNLWDRFSEAVSAKKAELSEENDWSKASSGRNPWSYRALRGSALGPTMAMLRSKNNI